MIRVFRIACACALAALLTQTAAAQESKAAKATREKLKQKGSVDAKDQGTKSIFDELLGEADKPIRFQIKNETGISNNTKLTFKAKDKTIEQILNDMSDKFDFGWYVVSEEGNNKIDGMVIIRKNSDGKERGKKFEKKKTSAPPPTERSLPREFTSDGKERGKKFEKKKTSAPPPTERSLPREFTLETPVRTRLPEALVVGARLSSARLFAA